MDRYSSEKIEEPPGWLYCCVLWQALAFCFTHRTKNLVLAQPVKH